MINATNSIKRLLDKANLINGEDKELIEIEKNLTGMTNDNYICSLSNGDQIVVRFPGKGTDKMINRQNERQNQDLVTKLDLNADILFYDDHSGIKVTRFIKNVFLHTGSIYDKIPHISDSLKKLHNSGVNFKNTFWIFDKFQLYETISSDLGIILCSDYVEMKKAVLKYQENLLENMQWRPCHNDPVLENFIMDADSRIYLIDWEYSGMNDPMWDIAAFALENNLNEEEETYFWNCYWGSKNLTPTTLRIIQIFKTCQDLLWYIWAKIKEFQGEDLLNYAQMRLNRAIHSLNLSHGERSVNKHYFNNY